MRSGTRLWKVEPLSGSLCIPTLPPSSWARRLANDRPRQLPGRLLCSGESICAKSWNVSAASGRGSARSQGQPRPRPCQPDAVVQIFRPAAARHCKQADAPVPKSLVPQQSPHAIPGLERRQAALTPGIEQPLPTASPAAAPMQTRPLCYRVQGHRRRKMAGEVQPCVKAAPAAAPAAAASAGWSAIQSRSRRSDGARAWLLSPKPVRRGPTRPPAAPSKDGRRASRDHLSNPPSSCLRTVRA